MSQAEASRGYVYYDGQCGFCTRLVKRFSGILARRGFETTPLQESGVAARLGLKPEELLVEMRVLTAEGRVLGGGDAVVFLAGQIWWAWPLHALGLVPGGSPLLRRVYRWLAARRGCSAKGRADTA
jgi:predicted DCC family thiol-disulfide oxidoreductase YuxK